MLGFLGRFFIFFWGEILWVWFHSSTKHNSSKGTFLQQFIFRIYVFLCDFSSSLQQHRINVLIKSSSSVSRTSNSPSINGELSLSTLWFPFHHQFISGFLYDEQSFEIAKVFIVFRKEIVLASGLIWSWTSKLSIVP